MQLARPVTVLAAGGTIAMAGAGGARPALDAAALVEAVPRLRAVPDLRARTLGSWPGVHLTGADALAVARAAAAEAAEGRGVVVTHGTDTLEETAVLCDVVSSAAAPVVLTGAIRPASATGADGPANLLDAVAVAGSAAAAGRGALVVFAGEVHAARAVRKSDSTAPAAFASPRSGPVGRVTEEAVTLWAAPRRPGALDVRHLAARVEIVAAGLASDGAMLHAALAAGADGIVAMVLGAGHAPPAFVAAMRAAAERVPVVACVRPESGRMLRATYGFDGAERDVRASGAIPAPALSPAAARIVLMAALGAGLDRAGVAAAFAGDDGA